MTKKTFRLQLTKGIIGQKFQTFNLPIYPYTKNILYCYETFFVTNSPEKVPYHVQGYKISDHQGLQCVTWSCLKVYFYSVNGNVCSFDSPNFCTYLTIENVPLFCTFLDLQNIPLFSTFFDLQNVQ